jgi:hypothetical protein
VEVEKMQKGFYEFRCVFMAFLFSALLFVLKDIVRGKVRAPMKMSYTLYVVKCERWTKTSCEGRIDVLGRLK